MSAAIRAYDLLIQALAVLAGLSLVAAFVIVIGDVSARDFGYTPPAWTTAVVEYIMLYATMLAAPWLVRTRGHVMVEALRQSLGPAWRRRLEYVVYVLCIVIGVVLTWFAFDIMMLSWSEEQIDIRAVEIPRSVLYFPLFLGFGLMTLEFVRYLVGRESLYIERAPDQHEGV